MDNYGKKFYGLEPMTLDEEADAPADIQALRSTKVNIIDKCNKMSLMLDTIKVRAKGIKEISDSDYSQLISDFFGEITKAYNATEKACKFGYEERKLK